MISKQAYLIPEINLDTFPNQILSEEETVLKGIASSPGMAFGKVIVIEPESVVIPDFHIPNKEIPEEIARFDVAVQELIQEFMFVLGKVKQEAHKVVAVIESNMMVLTDSFMLESIKDRIKKGFSVESSVVQEFDSQTIFLKNAKDQILRERVIELDHIKERLLGILRNKSVSYALSPNSIVVAQSVTPTDIVNFKEIGVIAVITEVGGIASHSSILTRTFEIPEVIGVSDATVIIKSGMNAIVDGYTGIVTINPTEPSYCSYVARKQKEEEHKKLLGDLLKLEPITLDKIHIHLLANVDFPEDVENSILYGSEGIGLVRSEHLMTALQRFPLEEEQFEWYAEIADRSYPNPVTIRAFDIGSDKFSEGMSKHESNPALGFRGIRFLLFRKEIFKSQIRAILRASKNKNIRFMLPMISGMREIEMSISLMEECKRELIEENLPFDKNIPLGIMIETPAAAIMADEFAKHAQFFSIGTNDLTQYTLAVDRTNEMVSEFFNSFHPSVLQLIKMTVDAASKHGIPVGICGELASHSAATSLLIGMGITELSVSPSILLELKNRVRETRMSSAKKLANRVLKCTTYEGIRIELGMA